MKKARGCAIRVPGTVPLRCASRSGAGLKTGVPFPAAPSAWLASLRDCTYTATAGRGARLTRRVREEYLVYFDRNATMSGTKCSGSAGMHRRSNAA